jgi:hypothetical protein
MVSLRRKAIKIWDQENERRSHVQNREVTRCRKELRTWSADGKVYECMYIACAESNTDLVESTFSLPLYHSINTSPPPPNFHHPPPDLKNQTKKPRNPQHTLKTSNPTQSPAQSSATHPPHFARPYPPSHSNKSQYPSPRPSPLPAQ